MDTVRDPAAAVFEATVFLDHFAGLPDPRQAGKVAYRLDEVLLLALLAILVGAEGFTDIARFGHKKLALLRRFLPFQNGTPSTIISATSLPRSTPSRSGAALPPGPRR